VVHSIALYAAPVWAAEMEATPYIQKLMRRAQRRWPSALLDAIAPRRSRRLRP